MNHIGWVRLLVAERPLVVCLRIIIEIFAGVNPLQTT